jgi:hypothetical protein
MAIGARLLPSFTGFLHSYSESLRSLEFIESHIYAEVLRCRYSQTSFTIGLPASTLYLQWVQIWSQAITASYQAVLVRRQREGGKRIITSTVEITQTFCHTVHWR